MLNYVKIYCQIKKFSIQGFYCDSLQPSKVESGDKVILSVPVCQTSNNKQIIFFSNSLTALLQPLKGKNFDVFCYKYQHLNIGIHTLCFCFWIRNYFPGICLYYWNSWLRKHLRTHSYCRQYHPINTIWVSN